MRIDKFGLVELNSDDSFNILYRGNLNIHDYFFDKDTTNLFNKGIEINKDAFNKLVEYTELNTDLNDFDKKNQSRWFMPKDYCENLIEWIYSQCNTQTQLDRVTLELELYMKHNMLDLLFFLKFLVDKMRAANIVWGVGRGSSVSSYVLYIIGIHKIDSIKYNLDIHEFFK